MKKRKSEGKRKEKKYYTQGADNGVVVIDQKDELRLSVAVDTNGFEDKVANLEAESPKTMVTGKRKKNMFC